MRENDLIQIGELIQNIDNQDFQNDYENEISEKYRSLEIYENPDNFSNDLINLLDDHNIDNSYSEIYQNIIDRLN